MKRVLALVAVAAVVSGCMSADQPEPTGGHLSTTASSRTTTRVAAKPAPPTLEPHLTVRRGAPWKQVGPGWHLVTVLHGPPTPDGVDPRAARIQLLDPAGRRTDVVVMDRDVLAGARPRRWSTWVPQVEDLSTADRTLLLRFTAAGYATAAVSLDLRTGRQRRARLPEGAGSLLLTDGGFAYLGQDGRLVSIAWDGTTTRLGRTDGSVLPLPDRSAVVTGHPVRVLGIDGSSRRLAQPPVSGGCGPRRWWDSRTVLATCSDGSLWLVPADGGTAARLTREPDPHGTTLDFGADDAVRVGDTTYVQKIPGCGTGWLAQLDADGTTTDLDGTRPQQLVEAVGDRLLVLRSTPCGRTTGLVLLDPTTLADEAVLTVGRREQLVGLRSWDALPVLVR